MSMIVDNEPIIAQCPLDPASPKKICLLSAQKLIVKEGSRLSSFELAEIKDILIKKKLLLLPLIAGGILTPLSLIAIFNELLNLWAMLMTFMAGALLMYYGWEGRFSFSVVTRVKEYDFFISGPNKNIRAFREFVLQRILNPEVVYYLKLTAEEWNSAKDQGYLKFDTPKTLTTVFDSSKDHVTLKIEPLKQGIPVHYISGSDSALVPVIRGKFPLEDFTKVTE